MRFLSCRINCNQGILYLGFAQVRERDLVPFSFKQKKKNLMAEKLEFEIWKGLQKPLVFKFFKGKFILWGALSLVCSLVIGGLTMSLINPYLGGLVTAVVLFGSLFYTAQQQKKGLYNKKRNSGIYFIQATDLRFKIPPKK